MVHPRSQPPSPSREDALVVIDVQYDFCPGGALAVPHGDAIIPVVNRLASKFDHVIGTQDWHPDKHLSFASSHAGMEPFQTMELDYGIQVLWPDHCVQETKGAALHADLEIPHMETIIRKGYRREIDSYSAFYENDHKTPTGLAGYSHERGLKRLFLTGLATDFCVHYSALDAVSAGFETYVVLDACRAIDLDGSLDAAITAMTDHGVRFINASHVEKACS